MLLIYKFLDGKNRVKKDMNPEFFGMENPAKTVLVIVLTKIAGNYFFRNNYF